MAYQRTNVRGEMPMRNKFYTENTVRNWLKKCAEEAGAVIIKNHSNVDRGIPDVIIHHNRRTFYVEAKATGQPCSDLQKEFHIKLKRAGIDTYVIDVKITNIHDLYVFCYTTYPGRYFQRNPWRVKDKHRCEKYDEETVKKLGIDPSIENLDDPYNFFYPEGKNMP